MLASTSTAQAVVADTAASADMLRIIADHYPSLRAQIALHQNADAALLDELGGDDDENVRWSVDVARRRLSIAGARPAPAAPAVPAFEPTAVVGPHFVAADEPAAITMAIGRGKRCGACGMFLNRKPGAPTAICPSCGVENTIPADTSRPSIPADWRLGDEPPAAAPGTQRFSDDNAVGIASLICGGIALVCLVLSMTVYSFLAIVALLAAIVGVICGIFSLRRNIQRLANNIVIAMSGLILSCLVFFVLLIGLIGLVTSAS
ncbi:MAG: 7TM-DISM domain-containing protein [Micrococcales bacterium]|nr:7TM-DISM domain-containing protein [Micrococcales bacterium]